MRIFKRSTFLTSILLIPVMYLACGPKFNKDEIKGELAKPLSQNDVSKIKGLPKKSSKSLNAQEQQELADIVINHMLTGLDHKKVGKFFCHASSLDSNKAECEKNRDECAKEVDKLSVEEIKKYIESERSAIKNAIAKSDSNPELYTAAFEVLNKGMDIAATMDCGVSKETMNQKEQEAMKWVVDKYGEADAKKIRGLVTQFLEFVGSVGQE